MTSYEVFKHTHPARNQKWAVQMVNGLICFRTKKAATNWATACKNADAEDQQAMIVEGLAAERKADRRNAWASVGI
jgi:hypothetical protein